MIKLFQSSNKVVVLLLPLFKRRAYRSSSLVGSKGLGCADTRSFVLHQGCTLFSCYEA
jgi:hypothetical protein